MLDQAFEALKTYDWGTDPKVLAPIDEALVATRGDAAARKELETRLAAVLKTDVSRDAKDFVCRKLMVIGTAASVPDAGRTVGRTGPLPHGPLCVGTDTRAGSGPGDARRIAETRRRTEGGRDRIAGRATGRGQRARAGRLAGRCGRGRRPFGRSGAGRDSALRKPPGALREAKPEKAEAKIAATDACLACAEGLLADGKKAEAMAIYKGFIGEDQPKHVRLAATRGMLACAGKSE